MTNKQREIELLVLDAHGVVFTSSFRRFLTLLANERAQSPIELLTQWLTDVRSPAWTGSISEAEIWRRLDVNTKDELTLARSFMDQCFDLGHAGRRLADWSRNVPVWMLSNHRTEWLLPRIRKFKLETYFANVVVSDTVGAAKPELAAFHPIVDSNVDPSRVLFVDDQRRNLDAAAKLGFSVIQATSGASWTKLVDDILTPSRPSSAQGSQAHSSTT